MPDPDLKPDANTGPVARDPLLGHEVPVYLGGEEPVVVEPTGDRGDDVPGSQPPSTEPVVPEIEPKDGKAPEIEPKAEELTDEQRAALPPARDPETGRFLPKGEEPGAKGEEAKDEDDDAAPRIPKVRLDKEIEKRRQLEARLKELEGKEQAVQQGAEQTYDFDAAEEEFMNLLLDGKLAEAKAKRAEIRAAERAEFQAVARQTSEATNSQKDLRTAIDTVADEMESAFPGFDPKSEHFDEAALTQAKAIYRGYLESGLYESPVDALRSALLTAAAANHWEPQGGAKPKPKAPPARTAAGRVAAIAGQPPLAAGAGQSGASAGAAVVPNPRDLTDDQLEKLPLATLKRLRGDEL